MIFLFKSGFQRGFAKKKAAQGSFKYQQF
jgi:hypothetical protein